MTQNKVLYRTPTNLFPPTNNSTSHKVGKIKINCMNNPCTTEDVEI